MTNEDRIEIKRMIEEAITQRIGNVSIATVVPEASVGFRSFCPPHHCAHPGIPNITMDGVRWCAKCGTNLSELGL